VEPTALLPGLEIHRREFRLRYGTGGIASARWPVLCLYFFELLTHAEALRSKKSAASRKPAAPASNVIFPSSSVAASVSAVQHSVERVARDFGCSHTTRIFV
jgi:hypothetical protein